MWSELLATLRTEMLNSISTRPTQNRLKQYELGSKILPPSRCFQQQRITLTTLGASKHLELPDCLPKCSAWLDQFSKDIPHMKWPNGPAWQVAVQVQAPGQHPAQQFISLQQFQYSMFGSLIVSKRGGRLESKTPTFLGLFQESLTLTFRRASHLPVSGFSLQTYNFILPSAWLKILSEPGIFSLWHYTYAASKPPLIRLSEKLNILSCLILFLPGFSSHPQAIFCLSAL